MKMLLTLLLALFATLTPAPAQDDFVFCNPPTVEQLPVPPCAAEKQRDPLAVAGCIITFRNGVEAENEAACDAWLAAGVARATEMAEARAWLTWWYGVLEDRYDDCIADGGDPTLCLLELTEGKSDAGDIYDEWVEEIFDEYDAKLVLIEQTWWTNTAARQQQLLTCILAIPCK